MILTVDKDGTEKAWNKMPERGHKIFDTKIRAYSNAIIDYQTKNNDILKNKDSLIKLKELFECMDNAKREYEDSEGWVGGGTFANKQYDFSFDLLCISMFVELPHGTIEKLTGHTLTWEDEPICLI